MTQRPYLNLGSGKRILPDDPQPSDWLIDPAIFHYPLWHNVDKVDLRGVDECVDLFTYPWPWADNSFDGALLSHLVEHIPHEVKMNGEPSTNWQVPMFAEITGGVIDKIHYGSRSPEWIHLAKTIESVQDGWFAFFSELTRVLTPGAIAHIISPYAWSQGAATDPTHTRFITEHVWTHQLSKADTNEQFSYSTGDCNLRLVEPVKFWITQPFRHLLVDQSAPWMQEGGHNWSEGIVRELQTRINVCYAIYVKLEAVK